VEIWVNPACSKCRAATKALDETGVAYTVRRYLDEPPTRAEWLQALVDHPRLIQRPIITADDGTTVVGHDPASLAMVLP
jgi:arsenate reductase (glutaredoxin)